MFALAAICAWGVAPHPAAGASLPAAPGHALSATLLPAVGEVETPQLAVRWPGRPGAALSAALRDGGRDIPLVANRALDTGANLVPLPLPAESTGTIRLLVRDATGTVLHRSARDLDALRQSSAFTWPAGGARAAAAPGLYAGGNFTQAGGAEVDRLAAWNGSAWSRLGAGPDGSVTALAVYDGDLIAGGSFLTAGGVRVNGIARWDGTTWSPLTGSSGTGVMTTSLDFVDALAVFDGDLIVGGQFLQAGGVTVNHIARWDGVEWRPLTGSGGTGVDVPSVWDLAVYDGALIVGGGFSQAGGTAANRIARWTGSAWSTLGTGFNGDVLALAVFDDALVATGGFTQASGVDARYVARWTDGGWTALGAGLNAEGRALTVFGAALVVGGTFTEAGGAPANYVARWDGSEWSALGDGTEDIVLALAVHDGRLIAGGFFTRAGEVAVNHVAGWNGSDWSALGGTAGLGTDAGVYTLHTV